jgi:hypothetical protein
MRIPMKKAALVSVVALSAASALFTGCKRPVEKADEAVSAAITKGEDELQKKPDGSTAIPTFSKAAGDKTASDPAQSSANLIAGIAELQAADLLIAQVEDGQLKIGRLVGRINDLASHVQANNVAVAGLQARDPKSTLAAISEETAGAKGGDKATWTISKADTILPTLDAADKSIADLSKQISDLAAKHEALEKQRNTDLQQADQLAQQSEQATGKKSVDLFKQAADLRKAGADLANEIISTDAAAAGLQRDLVVIQGQQKQLKSAVEKLDDASKQVAGGWADVQKHIEEYAASSKALVEGSDAAATPATNPASVKQITSIKQAGDELEQTVATVQKLRDDALSHLDKAAAFFGAMDRVNLKVQTDYLKLLNNKDNATAVPRQAWEWMVEVHNSSDPDLQRAQVQQRLARIFADQAWYADMRQKSATMLKDVLAKATVAVPKTLEAGELDKEMNDGRSKASQAFTDAEKFLDATIGRPALPSGNKTIPALKQVAEVSKMVEQYARWAYSKSIGDEKKDLLESARNLASTLSQENVPLPSPLPAEIAPASTATPPPTAPTIPAAPTTAPAGPGTPDATAPGTATNDTPEQAEVRKAYVAFNEALAAGDAVKAKTYAAADPQTTADIDTLVGASVAVKKFTAAVDAKFGAQAKPMTDAISAGFSNIGQDARQRQITVSADTAVFTKGPQDSAPESMKKIDGAWKVVAPTDQPQNAAAIQKVAKLTGVFEGLATDVAAGKFATLPDLAKGMTDAMAKAGITPDTLKGGGGAPPAQGTTPATPPTTTPPAPTPPADATSKPDAAPTPDTGSGTTPKPPATAPQ